MSQSFSFTSQAISDKNAFSAQICQELQPGSCGYAGHSVAFAHFRNGVDLKTLAADADNKRLSRCRP